MDNYKTALLRSASRTDTEKFVSEVAISFYEALDCPRALTASILLRYGELEQLINLSCDPLAYKSAYDFRNAYAASSYLSKYPYFDTGVDRKAAALRRFYEAEELCRITNERFRNLRADPMITDLGIRTIICDACWKISGILGTLDLDSVAQNFGWGPGATSAAKGNLTSAYNKFSSSLDVTANCLVMGLCCVNSTPSWVSAQLQIEAEPDSPSVRASVIPSAFRLVPGDKIVFVPKNAKTDRTIGVPPHVNSFIQTGFGRVIRRRLKRVCNIDLNDQTINQKLARQGSVTGELATIDLSMASDTVSTELVRFLLPDPWFSALNAIRSLKAIMPNGEQLLLEKFSAMGCGFTFELESLIFYALTVATSDYLGVEGPISVYGDDIICPSEIVDKLREVLTFCGFRMNYEKTHFNGPFRESCGKDFYLGTEVRPIFLKEFPNNVESLYRMANSLRRFSLNADNYQYCDRRFRLTWLCILQRIPPNLRYYVSEGYGDVGIIDNFDVAVPTLIRPKGGWEGFLCRAIIRVPYKGNMGNWPVAYATCLYTAGSDQPLDGCYTYRDRTYPKRVRILVRGWQDLGPWQ